ncbi:68103f83-09ad-43a8-83d0-9bfc7a0ecc4b [Thermothielavioides terrestris]|uniref:68103f83-09ad-43a8-83d0-9bfc7a0ecc4b n=1 Tax=Thermothielavioides terrestris TaxID=2587410 RepID=A0A3S4D0N8_9PEZI|nr:68103f83-09ad-43a8-83d0-9bfc7a0ecc4b [Thermothielavioides terrestris]
MAAKTGSSSPPPPPPQKPSWPWSSGRKRRSSESSVTTLRELVTGRRNSLSSAGAAEPNVLRKKPPPELAAPRSRPRTAEGGRQEGTDEKGAAAGDAKDKSHSGKPQKPQSRPPPVFFNKVGRRHTFSASAILRWYKISNDDDAAPLNPPPTRFRPSSSGGPPSHLKPTPAPASLRPPPRSPLDSNPRAMYPPDEHEFVLRTQRASTRVQQIAGSQPNPAGPGMEHTPIVHRPTAFSEAPLSGPERPGGYNVPRRLSNSSASSATSSVVSGSDGFDGRARSASFSSSQTSIDSWPNSPGAANPRPVSSPVTWATQNGPAGPGPSYPWHRPAPIKTYRRKAQPGELFAALPGEVLEFILEELRTLHLQPGSSSCATCWMRDCCAVAVSARKFLKYAREALYRHIQLVGHEGPSMKKRTKTTYGSRLVLLRRTLRANPQIAAMVRSLKPPARPLSVGAVAYNDLVASVVMACPNLERLVGFYPTYDHSFQRLFHALSTRPKLKEMNWILEPSPLQRQQRTRSAGPSDDDHWRPAELQPQESQLFLAFHSDWSQLTSLVVHCLPGAALSPPNLLECAIRSLPSLQNLYLSQIPPTTFSDTNLLSLPALKKLSLSHCPGVTTAGLSLLATRPASASIQTLTLVHMNVESLPAIARIFSYLHELETFNFVQTYPPEMPPDELIMLFPYLASASLRKLHWDIPYLPTAAAPADTILARSISAGGFPSLRALCTPHDPEGLFQALCSPRDRIDHPADRYRAAARPRTASPGPGAWHGFGHTRNSSSFSSTRTGGSTTATTPTTTAFNFRNPFPGGSNSSSNTTNHTPPASPLFPPPSPLFPPPSPLFAPSHDALLGPLAREHYNSISNYSNSNLAQARLAAQARLEAAQRGPARYLVHVTDERGAPVERLAVGAFLGTVESRVRYVLAPEPGTGATDEGGGLVGVEDMIMGDGGEGLGGLVSSSSSAE